MQSDHPLQVRKILFLAANFVFRRRPRSPLSIRKILFLAANPEGTIPLKLGTEIRLIKDALKRSKRRDEFDIQLELAVTAEDLRRAILDHQPEIVHFSGHGDGEKGVVFQDASGLKQLIPTEALADFFKQGRNHVRCVILNTCYGEIQADKIVEYIDYVVGMKSAISDEAAIKFAVGFYDALFAGKAFDECYDSGRIALKSENIPEYLIPVLKIKPPLDSASTPPESNNSLRLITLIAVSLVVAIITSSVTWRIARLLSSRSTIPRTAEAYEEIGFDPYRSDPCRYRSFTACSIKPDLFIWVDDRSGKLLASEDIPITISSIQPGSDDKWLGEYKATWRFTETGRTSNSAKMSGYRFSHTSFDGIMLTGNPDNTLKEDFDKFKQTVMSFKTADLDIIFREDGIVEGTITYHSLINNGDIKVTRVQSFSPVSLQSFSQTEAKSDH